MKYVFYTTDDLVNGHITGGTRRFAELVNGLLERGHHIHLFLPEKAGFASHPNLICHPVKVKKSCIVPNGLLNFLLNFNRLRDIRQISEARVVMVSVPFGIQGSLAGLKDVSLIIGEDFPVYRRMNSESGKVPSFFIPLLIQYWRWIEKYTLRRVSRVIVQCEHDRHVLLDRHVSLGDKLKEKLWVLPNNVNPAWLQEERLSPIQKKSDEGGVFNIGFIGNMDSRRKGLHLLLGAFSRLLEAGYKGRLHVIGEGKLRRHYMSKYGDSRHIIFYGHLPNPLKALSGFDLLVVPSLADSFPNTILEALFLGIPVMGSRSGGIPEMLHYDELLFEPREEVLYRKLAELFKDPKLVDGHLNTLCERRRKALSFDWVGEMEKIL